MIEVENLTKIYGDHKAVNSLSFSIENGHVYGFLGPNGAGKSTTMNIITGCLAATEGTVKIDGFDIYENPIEAKKCIGYLPEQPPLYMNETPVDYLMFVGEAKGLKGEELKNQVEIAIEKTGIQEVRNKTIGKLSKGYKQRVGIAQAILGNPKVIILDEPTVGLDPIQIIEIRDLIKELGKEHTVIFSSHILSEVQAICDKILIISNGKLLAFEDADKLEESMSQSQSISFIAETDEFTAKEILQENRHISDVTFNELADGYVEGLAAVSSDDKTAAIKEIFFSFAEKKIALIELKSKKSNIEDIFLELTEADNSDIAAEEEGTSLDDAPTEEATDTKISNEVGGEEV